MAFRDTGHSHSLHQVVDRPSGDALDVGLLDDRGQCFLAHPPRLEEAREVAALADFRDVQFNRARARIPLARTVAVAVGEAIGAAAAVGGSGEGFDFKFHQPLRGETDHLTQEVGVSGLFQQFFEVHVGRGHCRVLGSR
jgi:hypothetical protein